MSLRLRMTLLAGACVLPAIFLLATSQWQLRQARESEVRREIAELAQSEANEIGTIIGGARKFLSALERTPPILEHNAPLCSAWLARLRRDYPSYATIRADDLSGRTFCSSDPGRAAFEGGTVHFETALRTRGFAVGAYSLSPLTCAPELPLARSILADDGTVLGVLVVAIDLHWLAQDLAAKLPPDAEVTVVDRDNVVLARVTTNETATTTGVTTNQQAEGDDWIVARAPVGQDGAELQVIAARPKQAAFAVLHRTTREGAVLIVAALALAFIAAGWIGRHFISAPIEALLSTTERLRQGSFSARTELVGGTSELSRLGVGLNALAEALEEREAARVDAEDRLRQFNATLEQRVAQRTQALAEANQRLAAESEERQRTEAALAQVQKLDAIGKLTGGVAHDFNNLLAAMLGSLELALNRVDEPRLRRLLTVAQQAGQRGAKLTAHLLAFSRKQDLVLRPVDMNAIIIGMTDMVTRTLGPLVRFRLDLTDDLCPAMADPVQLEVALLNLAVNARDAMPSGGTLSFRTRNVHLAEAPRTAAALAPGDYAMVAVIDTGEGMSADVRDKAFEPFYTTKGPGKGTGLGLSLVHGFAHQAGGSITIDSTPGKGTAISLYLPRAVAAVAEDTATRLDTPATMSRLSVLLVDDDAGVRETVREMLHSLGHDVIEAPGGPAALTLLREAGPFDLLLADYAMPGMTGAQLAAEAATLRPELRVLLITGYVDADALRSWSDRGRPVLKKPLTRSDLAAALCVAMAHAPDGTVDKDA